MVEALHSVHADRQLRARQQADLLLRRFVDLPLGQAVFDASVLSKSLERLHAHTVAAPPPAEAAKLAVVGPLIAITPQVLRQVGGDSYHQPFAQFHHNLTSSQAAAVRFNRAMDLRPALDRNHLFRLCFFVLLAVAFCVYAYYRCRFIGACNNVVCTVDKLVPAGSCIGSVEFHGAHRLYSSN